MSIERDIADTAGSAGKATRVVTPTSKNCLTRRVHDRSDLPPRSVQSTGSPFHPIPAPQEPGQGLPFFLGLRQHLYNKLNQFCAVVSSRGIFGHLEDWVAKKIGLQSWSDDAFEFYCRLNGFADISDQWWLVSWYFEPSRPQRIVSGLKTNFSLSPSYSAHKSSNHTIV